MVDIEPSLDPVFRALGDPTRRAMLGALAAGDRSVGELAAPHTISLAAASKHIKALEQAGLLKRMVRGRTHLCRLEPEPLARAHAFLATYAQFWTARLDTLEDILRAEDAETTPEPPPSNPGEEE